MKLVLDEMYPPGIAVALRDAGHDVIAVQEDDRLRGLDDAALFEVVRAEGRTLVTENAGDFVALVTSEHAEGRTPAGVVFTSNRSFPRHRDSFVGSVVRALDSFLRAHPEDEASVGLWWLEPQ